jgi:hypothetical protein
MQKRNFNPFPLPAATRKPLKYAKKSFRTLQICKREKILFVAYSRPPHLALIALVLTSLPATSHLLRG